MNTIELLAPAKNLECGIAAIDHGADAVYIGPSDFGARHAVGNSIDDIHTLCRYAHQFGVKVYATVNTIIFDDEMDRALSLVRELHQAGVDAILIQDMGLLRLLSDGIDAEAPALHASTQTDNRTVAKVRWIRSLGFSRVVLARELTAEEIAEIHREVPDVELEVFVHGALCVSYSGQCYASEHCLRRSANRGECAQMCRMKYVLEDADGRVPAISGQEAAEKGLYYLSLKDQCQIDNLQKIIDAGACSLKIEGRLKDVAYVKNVVAAYSSQLNRLGVRRSSWGRVALTFRPDLKRSFNRGYTDYFLNGRHEDIASFFTPKAIGQYVGRVKEIRYGKPVSFNVATTASFVNGDGLCFLNDDGNLQGFRVNRAEGNRLYPLQLPRELKPGTALYRSQDHAFDQIMSGKTATRTIPLRMSLRDAQDALVLTVQGIDAPLFGEARISIDRQEAQKPQKDNMLRQLGKLGGTIYEAEEIIIADTLNRVFVPSSMLAELRRQALSSIEHILRKEPDAPQPALCQAPLPEDTYHKQYSYLHNIANNDAKAFYDEQGLHDADMAYELRNAVALHGREDNGHLLMQCRHCIRYSLGYCVKNGGRRPQWKEPLFLRLADGRRFRLDFDCRNCQMNVYY